MFRIPWLVPAVPGGARLCLCALLWASAALLTAPAEANEKNNRKYPTLEKALQGNAPKILDALRERKPQGKTLHVGVLKFRVQVGENPASDNIGPLNLLMASRLEAALILVLNDKDKIRILHDPSAVIWENSNSRANPDTPEGRKAFFDNKYPPAWGSEKKLPADLLLTGLVKIDDRAKIVEVVVQALDRTGEKPKQLCRFEALADPRLLTEAGVCFALPRGANPKDIENMKVAWENQDSDWPDKVKTVTTAVPGGFRPIAAASESSEKPNTPPTVVIGKTKKINEVQKVLREAPILFEVLYNGEKVKVREDGTVPEPPAGTKVTFRLKHKKKDEFTYGVVLKINGENTIFPHKRETDDFAYPKWILAPGDSFEIRGYQMDDAGKEAKEFKVLPSWESKQVEAYYGPHAGTFTVVIFQERRNSGDSRLVHLMNGNDVPAISRGVPSSPPEERDNTLKALQKKLQAAGQEQSSPSRGARGLIVQGSLTKQEVTEVAFKGYPIPVSVLQIRYYKPQSKEE